MENCDAKPTSYHKSCRFETSETTTITIMEVLSKHHCILNNSLEKICFDRKLCFSFVFKKYAKKLDRS